MTNEALISPDRIRNRKAKSAETSERDSQHSRTGYEMSTLELQKHQTNVGLGRLL